MIYKYDATTLNGEKQSGTIDAANIELAIGSLQRRNLIIITIKPAEGAASFLSKGIGFFGKIKTKEVVLLSRQLATLFEAQVPVLDSFKLLAAEAENPVLRKKLSVIIEDIQGGISMSQAMAKHPAVFSRLYVSMVRSGEESGRLQEIFLELANTLERNYELSSRARNALVYPAFVVVVFIIVVVLMMTFVIPRLSTILTEAGQNIPLFTRIILGISKFFIGFGPLFLIGLAILGIVMWRYLKTPVGKRAFSRFKISLPYIGQLYKKIYLSRISDNLRVLFSSGISMIRSLEITADLVNNEIYGDILKEVTDSVKSGSSLSEALSKYEDVPMLVPKMIKIGEESGKLSYMLETLARFYKREVDTSIETLVTLIEPALIIVLAAMVGMLLLAVIGPIYNLSTAI